MCVWVGGYVQQHICMYVVLYCALTPLYMQIKMTTDMRIMQIDYNIGMRMINHYVE